MEGVEGIFWRGGRGVGGLAFVAKKPVRNDILDGDRGDYTHLMLNDGFEVWIRGGLYEWVIGIEGDPFVDGEE